MAKAGLKLKEADATREKITKAQQMRIKKMYGDIAKMAAEKAKSLEGKDNVSSILRAQYLNKLEKQLKDEIKKISPMLKSSIESDAKQAAQAVVDANKEWAKDVGLSIKGAWSRVPTEVVNSVMSGQIYDSGWSLSKRIWGIEKKSMEDIHYVVAQGIAANKSAYDIAKDLEKYVDPNAKKTWDWSKVYPNSNKKIDYNAQRLARTLTQHAYQQSFKETTKLNPWISKYRWVSSNSNRTCPICEARDGTLYAKDDLPLDHPNGLCTWVAVIDKDWDKITSDIADWYNAPEGTYEDMDKFANSIYGT